MKFGYTILYVDDVPATLAFYGQAFGLATRYMHESGSYGELETGATALAFVSKALLRQIGKTPEAPVLDKPNSEIALVTDDVAAATARAIAAGATPISDPKQMPWGQTIAYVGDVNGFLVELCTPIDHG